MRRLLAGMWAVTVRGLAFIGFLAVVWLFFWLWIQYVRGAPAPIGRPVQAKPKALPPAHVGSWLMTWDNGTAPVRFYASGGYVCDWTDGHVWIGFWELKRKKGEADLLVVKEAVQLPPWEGFEKYRWYTWAVKLDRWGQSGVLTTGGGFKLVEVAKRPTD